MGFHVKICGVADPEQGSAIAALGATALGFICVESSPRYVTPERILQVGSQLPAQVARIGVFANAEVAEIVRIVRAARLTGVQLHGDETPAYCQALGTVLPEIDRIKALRVRDRGTLTIAATYYDCVEALLLDAYDPQQLGGTGHTVDWTILQGFCPPLPWFLAGGLKPENIGRALAALAPDGIDLSSGVERAPGDKDLERVTALFAELASLRPAS